jgi:hypothetical protein
MPLFAFRRTIMKRKLLLVSLLVIFLVGCSTSEADIETAMAQTEAARPSSTPTPESTNTPEPTPTPEPSPTTVPSPTAIVLPDVLHQTFSNMNAIYRDEFDSVQKGMMPEGWETTERNSIAKIGNGELKIDGTQFPGMVFYYTTEIINPSEGIYFDFKYHGSQDVFTLGFDNLQANGERMLGMERGFRSVAMQMDREALSAHAIQSTSKADGYFKGGIILHEDVWYHIVLAYDEQGNYIIKIWDPEAPKSPLTYMRHLVDFPEAYYFISWVSDSRTLWMDKFTIFTFESITEGNE